MKLFFLVNCMLLTTMSSAQCSSDRQAVQQYILGLYKDATVSPDQKITTLLHYSDQMQQCSYKNDSVYALLLQVIGDLYSDKPDYTTAIAWYKKSIDLLNTYPTNHRVSERKLVECYYWLSLFYKAQENVPEQMKAVNNCIYHSLQLGMQSEIFFVRCLYERAKYDFDIGDYNQCISDARMCEEASLRYIARPGLDNYDIIAGKSNAISSVGWYVQSALLIHDYSTAENFLKKKIDQYKNSGLDNYYGYIYSLSAEVNVLKGEDDLAILTFRKSLQYSRTIGDNFACKQVLNTMGKEIYLDHKQDKDKALACYREALGYKNKDAANDKIDRMESLNLYTNIANIFVQKKNYDSASHYFRLAFDQLAPGITEEAILQRSAVEIRQYPKVYYLENLFLDKANAFLERYKVTRDKIDIKNAIRIYTLADQLLDKIRAVQSDFNSKLFWLKDTRRLYEQAIGACYLQGDTSTAFYFFEKSRAVLLNDQVARQQSMQQNDLLKQAQIRKNINALQQKLTTLDSDSKEYVAVQSGLLLARQELDNLSVTKVSRASYNGEGVPVTLDIVKKQILHDHNGLMEIFSGDSVVYSLLITPAKTYFNRINKNDLEETAALYNAYVSDNDKLNRDFNGFRKVASKLYQLIFRQDPVPDGRIIISPDGPLFPFESLITDNDGSDPVYFLFTHATSYTYSARYLLYDFNVATTAASGNLFGIAPVQYASRFNLPPLTNSDVSLQKIRSCIGYSSGLVNKDASRSNFLHEYSKYRIIQLYTHASDSSERNEPVIYFADSSLYLSELIPEERPVTQLIVLSACETANGQLHKGEGVFSFNRGFALLGIPSSVSNLWSVDNLSTYELTEYFYKYLSKGLPIDVALQKAKIEFLQKASGDHSLPYYWAPSILTGKTDPVILNKSFPWNFLILLVVISGLVILGVNRYRRSRYKSVSQYKSISH